MTRTRMFLMGAVCALSCVSTAQDDNRKSHYAGLWLGRTALVLGSHEYRNVVGFKYGYGTPAGRLAHGKSTGQVLFEGYFQYSGDNGEQGNKPVDTFSLGGLVVTRWFSGPYYLDIGWGLNMADRPTLDLPSTLNSTPLVGVGIRRIVGEKELLYGIRWLHMSNANTQRTNYGLNQFTFMVEVRSF